MEYVAFDSHKFRHKEDRQEHLPLNEGQRLTGSTKLEDLSGPGDSKTKKPPASQKFWEAGGFASKKWF